MLLASGGMPVAKRAKKNVKVKHVTRTAAIVTAVMTDTGEICANTSAMQAAMEHVTSQMVIASVRMDIGVANAKIVAMKAAVIRVPRQMVIVRVRMDTLEILVILLVS